LKVKFRALEMDDLQWLYLIENDERLWKYSNTIVPFSKEILTKYILNSNRDIFDVKQLRMVVYSKEVSRIGLIDLYDFSPENKRLALGIIIDEKYRNIGVAKNALSLIEKWIKSRLDIHQIYVNIGEENLISIKLFKSLGYNKIGLKKDWNFYNNKFNSEFTFQKILND
jgi:diamine N-acetyltransferase|tara:strand:- start:71 stop:577 length:507 start_codon:yes stop_codon:yes gene_type:complete